MFLNNNNKTLPLHLRPELPKKFEKIKNGKYIRDESDPDYPLHVYLQEPTILVEEENSEIVNFLKGKNILITGGTGFLGKLLIEKILRACENVNIFLIVRGKKEKSLNSRIDEMVNSYVFQKLSEIRPSFRKNIIGINGDISATGLGLSKESRKTLTDKINLIYHVAATTRFDEPLKSSVQTNILGTKDIINLAKDCKHFKALVHISTAFANCHRKDIFEEIYEPVMDVNDLVNLTDSLPEDLLNRITPALLGTVPNTYCFTKQIAEHVVKEEAMGAVPTCICRPAIVLSTIKEPIPGWGEQVFGAMGYFIASGLGVIHVCKAKAENRADLVPADLAVNSFIAASYRTAKERNLQEIPVYNYVSSPQNPIFWNRVDTKSVLVSHFGLTSAIFDPFLFYTQNSFLYGFLTILLHSIPAFIVDNFARIMNKKPRLEKAYDKLEKYQKLMLFFIANDFNFKNTNTVKLFNSLNEVDKRNFNFDITSYDWYDYFSIFVGGVKEFILGEPMENIDIGRAHNRKLMFIRWTLTLILMLPVIYFLYRVKLMFV